MLKQGQSQSKYGTNLTKDTKFTTLIVESLDKKIKMVAFGQINKLDIRGCQLAALPLVGEISFFYFTIYLFLH